MVQIKHLSLQIFGTAVGLLDAHVVNPHFGQQRVNSAALVRSERTESERLQLFTKMQ